MTTDDNPQGNMRPPKGKYRPLYVYLKNLGDVSEWTTSFGEIERILGDDLPNSARRRGASSGGVTKAGILATSRRALG